MFYRNDKYIASFDEYDGMIEKYEKMPDVLYLDSEITETAMEDLFEQAKRKQEQEGMSAPSKTPVEFLLYMQTKISGNKTLYKDYQYLVKMIDRVMKRHLELIDTSEIPGNIVPFVR